MHYLLSGDPDFKVTGFNDFAAAKRQDNWKTHKHKYKLPATELCPICPLTQELNPTYSHFILVPAKNT